MAASLSFHEALKLSLNDFEIKYQLGVAYKELGIYEIGAHYFEEYILQENKDALAFFLLGICYLEIEDYPAAILVFQRANMLMPNDHRILYNIGRCYSGLKEESDAARKFRAALKINPEDSDIYYALGESYYKLNKRKKTKEILDILYMLDRKLYVKLSIIFNKS